MSDRANWQKWWQMWDITRTKRSLDIHGYTVARIEKTDNGWICFAIDEAPGEDCLCSYGEFRTKEEASVFALEHIRDCAMHWLIRTQDGVDMIPYSATRHGSRKEAPNA